MFRHITTRFAGLVILIAGVWGGLIPFLGPVFHFTLGPDHAWRWTSGRLWLSVLPAIAAILGGLILMGGGPRLSGRFGALIALAGGIWFAVGPDVSMLWNHGISQAGIAHGHTFKRMLEHLTLHSGLGVLITALAAYSLPGVATYVAGRRGRVGRDAAIAGTGAAVGAGEARHHDRVAAREAEAAGAGTGAGAGAATGAGAGAGAGAGTAAGAGTGVGGAGAGAGGVGAGAGGAGAREGAVDPAQMPPPGQETAAGTAAQPANDVGEPGTAAGAGTPRRRGGLAGLFSRR